MAYVGEFKFQCGLCYLGAFVESWGTTVTPPLLHLYLHFWVPHFHHLPRHSLTLPQDPYIQLLLTLIKVCSSVWLQNLDWSSMCTWMHSFCRWHAKQKRVHTVTKQLVTLNHLLNLVWHHWKCQSPYLHPLLYEWVWVWVCSTCIVWSLNRLSWIQCYCISDLYCAVNRGFLALLYY